MQKDGLLPLNEKRVEWGTLGIVLNYTLYRFVANVWATRRSTLPVAIQMLKQNVAHKLGAGRFWQTRYYDFLVWSRKKRIEKLKYMHRNPVERGLVERPEDWPWSSFLHCATGLEGTVEIESEWTARRRERMGVTLRVAQPKATSHPVAPKAGATRVGQPRGKLVPKGWASPQHICLSSNTTSILVLEKPETSGRSQGPVR